MPAPVDADTMSNRQVAPCRGGETGDFTPLCRPSAFRGHVLGVTGPRLGAIFGVCKRFLLPGWLNSRPEGRRRKMRVQNRYPPRRWDRLSQDIPLEIPRAPGWISERFT
jgi:hypothetical protein